MAEIVNITRGIPLVDGWRTVLRQAHSIRWTLASIFFVVAETVLPIYQEDIPRGRFAIAAALAGAGSILTRIKDQQGKRDGH